MSKDNVLKKQFTRKEVTRLRNIVKGKEGGGSTKVYNLFRAFAVLKIYFP